MVGLTVPTSGTATINGEGFADLPNPGLEVGVLLDASAQHAGRTGRETLRVAARTMGLPSSRVDEMLELVSLSPTEAARRVRNYSLGMRQRLGIAQAMLGQPKVLILDEPANGLDPAGIREIRELLRGLAAEREMAVFVSSHLLAEIELTADRVAIIHKGRILRSGPVRELISSNRVMEFRVGDADRAGALLRERGLELTSDGDVLLASMDENDAPPIVAMLVNNGIDVFHARPRVQTLEEMFLDVTGGESVD
ncbi:MAG TPA: ATP-binding cassette domain-containing protein, partial [Thermoanaerobaculia bacterium]|nr:ATP-binding cassette domain-containing protein [Thermoanaerobaculia bacterium]